MSAQRLSVTEKIGQPVTADDSNAASPTNGEPRVRSPGAHPLASLIREHELIGPLAEGLASFAEALSSEVLDPASERADLEHFVRVFTDLADCVHHEKEEAVLLPFLCRHGFEWTDGPLAEVRREHRQERYLIDVLCQAAAREETWNHEERRRIVDSATALADFQSEHLAKENTLLFPAVMLRTSPAELELLEAELAAFDASIARFMPCQELATLARDLIARYRRSAPLEPATANGESRGASAEPAASGRERESTASLG